MKLLPSGILTLVADGRVLLRAIKLIFNLLKLFKTLKNKIMWNKIKLFIHQIITKLENDFESYITKYVVPTIAVLNEVKKAIDNPVVDWAAKLAGIPGFAEIKAFLDKAIPQAVLALGIIQVDLTPKVGSDGKPIPLTIDDYLNALVTYLQAQPAMTQAGVLTELAGFITKIAHGTLTQAQAVLIVKSAEVKLEEEAATATPVAEVAPEVK